MKEYEVLKLPIAYNHPTVKCGERRYTFEITHHDDYGEICFKISLFAHSSIESVDLLYSELSEADIDPADVTITRL
jgi:hypothetical protein